MVNMNSSGASGKILYWVTEKHVDSLIDNNREAIKTMEGSHLDDIIQKNMIFVKKYLFGWLFAKANSGEKCFFET